MKTIAIQLDETKERALREKAARFGLQPEQLLTATVEALIEQPDTDFDEAVRRVLEKNRELYRRLA